MKKKVIFLVIALISTAGMASFLGAFPSQKHFEQGTEEAPKNTKNTGSSNKDEKMATLSDFKSWLVNYNGVSEAERNVVFGMVEQNITSAQKYFAKACDQGDERGCFQLGLSEVAQQNADGLDRLLKLSLSSKNSEIGLKSAQLIGAYVLDFAPNNKKAVEESLNAVVPYAAKGDPQSQFIAANLFLAMGVYSEADSMLTLACNNDRSPEKVKEYCRSSKDIERVGGDGGIISAAIPESTCPNK